MISSVILYLLAIPTAFVRPGISVLLMCLVAVLWLLPPRAEERAGAHQPNQTSRK
jgi:hypothetical protein